jgi:putative ABC transport system permease protein
MLDYQLGLAWRSLKRNPVLSLLSIGGIGLGIAVSMMFVTAYYYLAGDPIPAKSDRLFNVRLDAWDPARPYDSDEPGEPPDQLTYMDAMALMKSDVPTYRTAMHKAELTVYPERKDLRPFRALTRLCFADFFPMFDVPFRYGTGWRREDDEGPAAVAVLDSRTNQKLFGGEDSVGKSVRIEGREFRVVGVLDDWRPLPKFYDTTNDPFERPEGVFLPFHFGRVFEIYTAGNTSSWGSYGNAYADLLQSEAVWLQYWVQLDDARQREAYDAWIAGYSAEQGKLGRMARAQNNKVRDVMTSLRVDEIAPEEARSLMIIALLFLLVCSVNLIGILLGKFLARAPEVGVRRALGASRRHVFAQHLFECGVIGVAGAVLGLLLTPAGLALIDRLFDQQFNFKLDPTLFGVAMILALLSAFVAGVYPAWRVCRTPPALHLKTQ